MEVSVFRVVTCEIWHPNMSGFGSECPSGFIKVFLSCFFGVLSFFFSFKFFCFFPFFLGFEFFSISF
jgi:hypothetical protein